MGTMVVDELSTLLYMATGFHGAHVLIGTTGVRRLMMWGDSRISIDHLIGACTKLTCTGSSLAGNIACLQTERGGRLRRLNSEHV